MSFWRSIDRYIFSYNVSFWGDFWGSELTDRKCLKCHFGEIFENLVSGKPNFPTKKFSALRAELGKKVQILLFWRDFSTSIYVILGRFRGKNKK
jgi:hypothetical protein